MKIAFAGITDLLEFGQMDKPLFEGERRPVIDPVTGDQVTYKRNFISFKNIDEIDGTVVGEIRQGKDRVSIELHDKLKALNVYKQIIRRRTFILESKYI